MSKLQILLFAGTTEGREMAETLGRMEIPVSVSVATEYGETLLPVGDQITHLTGRMDEKEMGTLMQEGSFSHVIDATHPYAVVVSENIKNAANEAGLPYIRLLRAEDEETHAGLHGHPLSKLGEDAAPGSIYLAASVKEACQALAHVSGNILASTGSKELKEYTVIEDYKERVFARVLSTEESVSIGRSLGFEGKNLICMQGPFSEEMNYATMLQYGIRFLVTKASGKAGGFAEKIRAAKRAGAAVVVIGRPKEEGGYSFAQVKHMMEELSGKKEKKEQKIYLVSIGTGSLSMQTRAAGEIFKKADAFIGAARMLEVVKDTGKPVFASYKNQEILDWILEHPEYERIAILFSGDVGFYSGAKKLYPMIKDAGLSVFMVPGISSLTYLAARVGVSWEDAKLMSVHGRNENLVAAVRDNRKVFTLLGGKDSVRQMCEALECFGLSQVKIWVGEELSYPGERIVSGTPGELREQEFLPLTAAYIENETAIDPVITHGIMDEDFLRDKVPMTKMEVRAVSLSAMQLKRDSVVYDVGAGTGSVSIEAALMARDGFVYAIEKKPEACDLILANQQKFRVSNLQVVRGLAPEALAELPKPDVVFIGGSSGNMKEVLEVCLSKNPGVHVVINAIALETIAEVTALLKELPVEDVYISQIQAARAKKLGNYEMMMGQNPVTIFSFTGREEE